MAGMAGIALLTAACGGGPANGGSSANGSSHAGGSSRYQSALAYASCMRSHGVPDYPDPNSNGLSVSNGNLGVSQATMNAADHACSHLLPNGGKLTPGQTQQALSQLLKFARCMRSHGVPNFPDPANHQGAVGFHVTKGQQGGIDPQSPQFQAAQRACQSLMTGALP
jgi:hypothetical protein